MLRLICKFLIVCVAAGALVTGIAGCSQRPVASIATQPADATPSTRPFEQQVTIDNFNFNPQVVTVARGTKVTWVNRDDVPHTATSSDSPPKFKSKALDTDDRFSFVFTQPGVYPYFCAVHPKMTAKIVVK